MKQVYLTLLSALLVAILLLLPGCQTLSQEDAITVTIVANGTSQVLMVNPALTVSDVLRQAGITPGQLDRVNPPTYSRVTNGTIITVVEVVEETLTEEEIVPFQSRTVPNDALTAGERQLLQPGINGIDEVTYRIIYEDGVEVGRSEIRRIAISPPQDEVIMVGSQGELATVTVNGTLAYISGGNAWLMQQNSANRRLLTLDGRLDGKVFELSDDGGRLLFTQSAPDDAGEEEDATAFNTLWAVLDTSVPEPEPVRLDLENILFADWVAGTERTIVYSTAEPRDSFPGWQANNDLWRAQVSPTGAILQPIQLLEASSGGIYGWYGTTFAFAPDGVQVAWAQPDAAGVLLPLYEIDEDEDEETETEEEEPAEEETPTPPQGLPIAYQRQTLATFAPWNAYDFIWVPTPVWSPDSALVSVVVHGAPLGSEAPEDSPVFNLLTFSAQGDYSVTLLDRAGMWAAPVYSPAASGGDGESQVYLAYLQAVDELDSVYSHYRVNILDRDGSNRRVVYPPESQPGLMAQNLAWAPDGQQIALVAPGPTGNILLVDIATGLAQQVTTDGQSSVLRWVP